MDLLCHYVTDGAFWFAFFVLSSHSDGLVEVGTCFPFVKDASVKILHSQGFLVIQKTCIIGGVLIVHCLQ